MSQLKLSGDASGTGIVTVAAPNTNNTYTVTLPAAAGTFAQTDVAQTFTGTQTFSSNPVLSGGTANGVLYLNGSKVATSGSALTFDGTTLSVVGASRATTITGNIIEMTRAGTNYLISSNAASSWEFRGPSYAWMSEDGVTQRMTLNSSGNLGLGVTPSGWDTTNSVRALQLTQGAVWGYSAANMYLAANNYWNGTNRIYLSNNTAGEYRITGNVHAWMQAPLGTANTAITSFTQAMTLDASANLTITPGSGSGLAATQTGLNVFGGASAAAATSPGVLTLGVNSTAVVSGEVLGRIQFYSNDASGSSTGVVGKIDCVATSNFVGDCETALTFHTNDGVAGTIAERARITSGGNLLVGATADYLSSRLLVDSSGTTSSTNILSLRNSSGTEYFRVRSDGYTYAGFYVQTTASAANVFIGSGGDLLRSTSSLKYKTNVQDAVHGLAEVMQLRSVTYKGKKDGDTVFGGLIAEEVHAAGLTEFVHYAPDGSPDAIAYGNMISLLTKAIQELKADLDATKAELAALKGA